MNAKIVRQFQVRWLSKKEDGRKRVLEALKKKALPRYIVPWQKEPESETFVESRLSNKMAAFLTKKGVFDENDPAKEFKKGWIIASATVLTRAHVLEPQLPIDIAMHRERKFFQRDSKNKWVDTSEIRPTNALADLEKDVYFFPRRPQTEADLNSDMRSTWRKLDRSLFFVFKSRKSGKFQFPQRVTSDEEPMRGSAKKALQLVAGTSIQLAHHVGYSPLAVYKRVFNEEQQKKTRAYGAKVFFFPAYLVEGNILKLDQGYDFRWLTKEECAQNLAKDYYAAVKDMLTV